MDPPRGRPRGLAVCSIMKREDGAFRVHNLEYTEANPATYADWSSGEWDQETTGKEDGLRSPYLDKEFAKAREMGVTPSDLTINGSWSALSAAGEATNLNLVHLPQVDCTDVDDLTR